MFLCLSFIQLASRLLPKPVGNCWFSTMWQGSHAGGQNNKILFTWFAWKKSSVPSGEKHFCFCPPAWPPWRQLKTSNSMAITSPLSLLCNHSCQNHTKITIDFLSQLFIIRLHALHHLCAGKKQWKEKPFVFSKPSNITFYTFMSLRVMFSLSTRN